MTQRNTQAPKGGTERRNGMTDTQFIKFLRSILAILKKCQTLEEAQKEIEQLLQQ